MNNEFIEVWSRAWDYYHTRLSSKECNRISKISSQEDLLIHYHALNIKYSGTKTAKNLKKTQTFVAQLRAFSTVINTIVQAKPDIAGIVWGPLALILEEYLKEFGPRDLSARLQHALICYYAELIAQYQDAIEFLRAHPIKNFLFVNRRATRFSIQASKRLTALQEKTAWVEAEVDWEKYKVQQEQHNNIIKLISANALTAMTEKLPYKQLPYRRNLRFHFRGELMARMKSCLTPGTQDSRLLVVSLYGLGGIGKTQLALEYAYEYAEDYDAIFWMRAETEQKLKESFLTHARLLELESPGSQQDAALIRTFIKWLMTATTGSDNRRVKWLMIFDNVEDEHAIDQDWPVGAHGSIILTTRNREVAAAYGHECLEVPLFTPKESLIFMLDINPYVNATKEEFSAAQSISDRLGNMPLVLHSIGSYTRMANLSYASFLQHYADFDTNLLFRSGNPGSFYETSIHRTWTMALRCISSSRSLHTIDTAASTLIRISLVTRNPEGNRFGCHRIVREAILKSIESEDLAYLFDWAVFALNACFPKTLGGSPLLKEWNDCALLQPHLSALMVIYRRFQNSLRPPILLCEVIRRCAWYLSERGNFRTATGMVKEACSILHIAIEENNHPGYFPQYMRRLMADMYNTFGTIEYELNLPDHGRQWFEKADLHRAALIEDGTLESYDVEVMAIVDGNIALTHLARGVAEPSIYAFKLLLDTFHNKSSRGVWAANLSIAYRAKGLLDDSLLWCRQSFDWTLEAYGADSLSMAIVQFNTGNTLLAMKQDIDALSAFEYCLRIRQSKSPTHSYTAFVCHKLGSLLRSRADLTRAA
ncbi:hypothetical protein HDV64DRAFT_272909 [Trichoderma sp. TUCIM 5745]